MTSVYERPLIRELTKALRRSSGLITVIIGPRQVGKTTAAEQLLNSWKGPKRYAAADSMAPPQTEWIETQWVLARKEAETKNRHCLLVLDEIQKVPRWSEQVKSLWDEDRRLNADIVPILLGSSSLMLHRGLSESLAGRFQLFRFTHWNWSECKAAFGWDLDHWLFFGGYPGAAKFADNVEAWRNYVTDSLIDTAITRDVVQMQNITKPALMRHLFALSALFPAQIFSYNKMLGQLHDAGNTTTLSHYLKLLETAFLVRGLEQYSAGRKRKHGSSPKLILWNNALVNAFSGRTFQETREDGAWWGRIVENAVGAHLLNYLQGLRYEISYWRERSAEVDFVVQAGSKVWAVEVKSGRPGKAAGLEAIKQRHPKMRALMLGSGGMSLKEFFLTDPAKLFV